MKLTNRLNLPLPLVRAIENDTYDAGDSDYTATSLIQPPRILALKRGNGDKMVEDAADRIWALFGQVVHGIIERAGEGELVEKRLFMEIGGKKISGQIDLWQGKILWDWKTTSVYAGRGGAKDDWIQQGNINNLLCVENGINVEQIQFVALYRDWSLMRSERTKENYPEAQVQIFNLPMWSLDYTRAFIEDRIARHEKALTELPLCTADERWQEPAKFAVMKRGQKRAVKLYESLEQAEAAAEQAMQGIKKIKHYVEDRPSIPKRCLYFCPVSGFCTQFREQQQGQDLLKQEAE